MSDSDGTAILYHEALKGGTRLTRNLCALLKRAYVLINAAETRDPIKAADKIVKFIEDNNIETRNPYFLESDRSCRNQRLAP